MGSRLVKFDDVSGESGDDVETIQFAIDGRSFTIDLDTIHAFELREAFEKWITHATVEKPPASARRGNITSTAERADCRAFAELKGIKIPAEGSGGRLPVAAWTAFRAAGSPKREMRKPGRKRVAA